MQYFAFVQRDETGGYLATLPDFPGCSARAPSWLQLEGAIRTAVRDHMRTRTGPVPTPTPIELFDEDSAPPNSCWMHVTLFAHEVQASVPTFPVHRRARNVLGHATPTLQVLTIDPATAVQPTTL